MDRIAAIRDRLEAAFSPDLLEIEDQSWMHAGHAGAKQGGHFLVRMTSGVFGGKKTLERHRMVYSALDGLMKTEIHALTLELSEA